jgi:hypothetical protein
MTHHVVLP